MCKFIIVAALLGGCTDESVPSCQQAVTHFYGSGCSFFDLTKTPPVPYSQNESITSCKQVTAAVPDRCQAEFDDYMLCLDGVPSGASDTQCASCSDEQDALFGCQ